MSERTHSPNTQPAARRNKLLLGIGTAVLGVTVTAIAIQFFGGADSQAKPMAPRRSQQDGKRDSGVYYARVGKTLVPYETVAEECVARFGQEVLENIINRTMIQQACAEANVTVSESEVTNEIHRIAKRFNIAVDAWLRMLQEERGLTPAQYQRDVIWPMLALKKLAREDIAPINENDVKRAFQRDYGQRVKAKMIMFDNLRHAQEKWEEIVKHPNDFERLAREYSIEPNSRSLGGSIPPIRAYAGNEALEKAAFKLKPGEISGIIQVGYNRYVVLLCEGRTERIVTDVEDVREEITELLREEKVQAAVAAKFDEIKRSTRVDNYLTNTSYGGDVEQVSGSSRPGGATNAAGQVTIDDPMAPVREAARQTSPIRSGGRPAPTRNR